MTQPDPRRERYAGAITDHLWGSPEDIDEATTAVMEIADDERGGTVCTCTYATPCGCGASAHYDQPAPAATEAAGHRYLSTGCLHGEHGYCSNVDGIAGLKKPAQCKFCTAPCICPCHQTTEA